MIAWAGAADGADVAGCADTGATLAATIVVAATVARNAAVIFTDSLPIVHGRFRLAIAYLSELLQESRVAARDAVARFCLATSNSMLGSGGNR